MINLLPPETRENIMYARRNTRLRKWAVSMVLALFGVIAVVVFGLFYIDQNTRSISRQVDLSHQQLKIQNLEQTQKRVEDISNSLKLSIQVLSKQILFSDLLQQIGAVMPTGASLSSLSISKVSGGIDLQVIAKDYQSATQVQVNLQDPNNKIFQKVDIVNISCNSIVTATGEQQYPCTGSYRALFNTNNPFLFIKGTK